mmetsp:Transcript_801/g.1541  ORF Transcript_801/g.1541 Transcript_801/m.1541 type:complete len:203 (+) Transcript_801:1335-1943(+)
MQTSSATRLTSLPSHLQRSRATSTRSKAWLTISCTLTMTSCLAMRSGLTISTHTPTVKKCTCLGESLIAPTGARSLGSRTGIVIRLATLLPATGMGVIVWETRPTLGTTGGGVTTEEAAATTTAGQAATVTLGAQITGLAIKCVIGRATRRSVVMMQATAGTRRSGSTICCSSLCMRTWKTSSSPSIAPLCLSTCLLFSSRT